MSTVRKIMDLFAGQYAGCEFYKPVVEHEFWSANGLRHIKEDVPENAEVLDYRLLGEDEYNMAFWMPMGEHVSFRNRFGGRDVKILCMVLPGSGQFVFRRRLRIGNKAYALLVPADSIQEADQKAQALVILGIWHRYLDLSNVQNQKIFQERERYYKRKGRYPEDV